MGTNHSHNYGVDSCQRNYQHDDSKGNHNGMLCHVIGRRKDDDSDDDCGTITLALSWWRPINQG